MRQLPPLGKRLSLDLAAAVAQRDKKVMPLLWDPDRGWLTWLCQSLIKRVLLWCVLQPASATTDRTPSPGICQAHGDKSCCSWARGEEWKPSKRDSTYAVGNPKTCSQPSRPPSCCRWVPHHSLQHRGRNFSVKNTGLAVPWPPETRGGEGLRVRTGPMELRRHRALEEEPSWASVCMAESVVTKQPVSAWHHRSQDEKEFQPVGGLSCAGFVQGEQEAVLCTYANRDPLVTLSHMLNTTPRKKALLLQNKSRRWWSA